MKVSFRIRKIYFEQIVSGEKKYEFRADTEYWRKRLLRPSPPRPTVAVFSCGGRTHRRKIMSCFKVSEQALPEYLNRPVSEQGVIDLQLDKHNYVIGIELGEVVE